MSKPCVKCGLTRRNGKGACMDCARAQSRSWRARHPYAARTPSSNACTACQGTERYRNGDCKACAIKRSTLFHHKRKTAPGGDQYQKQKTQQARLNKYGLTSEGLTSMLEEYGGLCAICRDAKATHIDHDHATGYVRGVLCHQCNVGLGCFKDSPDRLHHALAYLAVASLGHKHSEHSEDGCSDATT